MSYREENKVIHFVPQTNYFGDPVGTEHPVFDFNTSSIGAKIDGYEYLFLQNLLSNHLIIHLKL